LGHVSSRAFDGIILCETSGYMDDSDAAVSEWSKRSGTGAFDDAID
jgi:hypothetical protein